MNSFIAKATAALPDSIKGALDTHHITLDTLTEELNGIVTPMVHRLENIPFLDMAPGLAAMKETAGKILCDTTLTLNNLATSYGIKVDVVTTYLGALKPQVHALIVAVGMSIFQFHLVRC